MASHREKAGFPRGLGIRTPIRSLTEGYLVLFASIGCVLFALLSAASG
jgi:hypothetical protein